MDANYSIFGRLWLVDAEGQVLNPEDHWQDIVGDRCLAETQSGRRCGRRAGSLVGTRAEFDWLGYCPKHLEELVCEAIRNDRRLAAYGERVLEEYRAERRRGSRPGP